MERARAHDEQRRDLAEDRAERVREHDERRRDLAEDRAEQQRVLEQERRLRLLEQLDRLSELVAGVRHTARDEADPADQGRIGSNRTAAPFFWNARKELELGIGIFEALGGPELPSCRDLATGSAMQFLSQVVGGATSAFEELNRTAQAIGRDAAEQPPHRISISRGVKPGLDARHSPATPPVVSGFRQW